MDCIRNRRTGRKAPGPCKARWDSLLVKFRNYTIRDGKEKGGGGKGGIWMPVKVIFINSFFIRVTKNELIFCVLDLRDVPPFHYVYEWKFLLLSSSPAFRCY